MAIAAFKTSAYRNAVSRLHRQRLAADVGRICGRKLPVWEVPITSITNGVHLPTWINGDLAQRLRPVPAAGLARSATRSEDLGSGRRDPRRGAVGSASAAQAAAGRVSCASARLAGGHRAQRVRRRKCGGLQEVLDPEALHHRIRAPLRHLQARHAAVPRHRAPEADSARIRACRCRS